MCVLSCQSLIFKISFFLSSFADDYDEGIEGDLDTKEMDHILQVSQWVIIIDIVTSHDTVDAFFIFEFIVNLPIYMRSLGKYPISN